MLNIVSSDLSHPYKQNFFLHNTPQISSLATISAMSSESTDWPQNRFIDLPGYRELTPFRRQSPEGHATYGEYLQKNR